MPAPSQAKILRRPDAPQQVPTPRPGRRPWLTKKSREQGRLPGQSLPVCPTLSQEMPGPEPAF